MPSSIRPRPPRKRKPATARFISLKAPVFGVNASTPLAGGVAFSTVTGGRPAVEAVLSRQNFPAEPPNRHVVRLLSLPAVIVTLNCTTPEAECASDVYFHCQ